MEERRQNEQQIWRESDVRIEDNKTKYFQNKYIVYVKNIWNQHHGIRIYCLFNHKTVAELLKVNCVERFLIFVSIFLCDLYFFFSKSVYYLSGNNLILIWSYC